jgi:hypothetical protein
MENEMPSERHSDVEFVVDADGTERSFESFSEALTFAFSVAPGESEVNLDVLVYSEEGAEWFGGDDAVARYQEDPDASIFQRFQLRVSDLGRIS